MPPISVLMKPSSGLCNMSCDYCFYCDETQKRVQESYGFMSEDTLKNIIRRTLTHAEYAAVYVYQGGEPTLRGLDFYEKSLFYQKKYNKNNVRINNALQTNGFVMDKNWCSFFRENHFLIGLSVDGTKNIHDTYRHDKDGDGSYDKVSHTAELFDQYGVDYNILTVVNRKVALNIEEIYKAYKKRGWKYQQYIACLDPLKEEHGKKEYALTPQMYGDFLTKLFGLWYKDLQSFEQPYIRQFENYARVMIGYKAEACEHNGVCGLQYVVEADGSVFPCDFYMLDEYKLGNFNEDKIDIIDKKRKEIGFVENSRKLSVKCKQCKYLKLCKGGCQRNRDFLPQDGTYENYLCGGFQLFFDQCFDKMARTLNEYKNSGYL